MLKNTFFLKKYKLKQLQQIKQTFKYIYFFSYNDFKINEIIFLKKKIKKLHYKTFILNKKLINYIFPKLKGHGSILIIYGNNNLNLIQNLIKFKKLNLISLVIKNNIYSFLKIKTILKQNNFQLNYLIIQPFLNFIYFLKKI